RELVGSWRAATEELRVEQLRLPQSAHPRLPERFGVELQMTQPPHRTTEHISARLHCRFPCARIDVETRHDRRKRTSNVASLVVSDCATGPIDELKILLERVL